MTYPGNGRANYHNGRFGPLALWQFNDVITDSAGSGLDLTVEAGTENYCDVLPGLRGFHFDGNTSLIRNLADPVLRLLGDMTVEFVLCPTTVSTKVLIIHDGVGEDPTTNYLYSLSTATLGLSYFAEFGAGNNIQYSVTGFAIPVGTPYHIAMVRASGQITYYVNGSMFGIPSTGLQSPTDGSAGRFRVGSDETTSFRLVGAMSSLKMLPIALSASQVAAEYNLTLGGVLGYI